MEQLKDALIASMGEVLPMFGLQFEYLGESEIDKLESASQVNIITGIRIGNGKNMVFGMDKSVALKIVSAMMGGMEITQLDDMTKSALGEMMNMLMGSTIGKLTLNEVVEVSPPTIVTGKRLFIMVSRTKSHKLAFKIGDSTFNFSFSLDS